MKYRIYDDKGLIADAKTEEEAYKIFGEIHGNEGKYKDFETTGDLVLVQILHVAK